jgi:phosphate transport system substrate-binding protein
MKKTLIYIFILATINSAVLIKASAQQASGLKGSISISGAFALYPLAVKWAEEFKKLNPKVKIDISAGGAGKGMTDALSKLVDIGMVSREVYAEERKKGAFDIAVTKDAVVPTISANNPYLKEILEKGLKKEAANNIFITGTYKTWGQATGIKSNAPIRAYTRSDASGSGETWAKYFGEKQEDILGVGVFGDPGLALAVSKDKFGIGYNNIAYAYDAKTKQPNTGLKIIPLDLNNNGKIDADENFYNTLDDIVNAISSGKYPTPPARDQYFVTYGKPMKKEVIAFINWVLTDGQKYVHDAGFVNLSKEKLEKEALKLK